MDLKCKCTVTVQPGQNVGICMMLETCSTVFL